MKRCRGCGAVLQTEDRTLPGYTPKAENDYCQRCFRLIHYDDLAVSMRTGIDPDLVLEEIRRLDRSKLPRQASSCAGVLASHKIAVILPVVPSSPESFLPPRSFEELLHPSHLFLNSPQAAEMGFPKIVLVIARGCTISHRLGKFGKCEHLIRPCAGIRRINGERERGLEETVKILHAPARILDLVNTVFDMGFDVLVAT